MKWPANQPLPPSIGEQSTLLSAWAVVIYRLLEFRGLDARQLFQQAKINPLLLSEPGARIPHTKIGEVWQRASQLLDDETLGLDAAVVIYPGMYHSLSSAMFAAPNLKTALQYMTSYRRIFHPLSRMQLDQAGDTYQFSWGPRKPYVTLLGADAIASSLIGLCRQLTTQQFSPTEVFIQRPLTRKQIKRYEQFFLAPVYANQHENRLVFNSKPILETLNTANPVIESFAVKATRSYIATLDDAEFSNTVYCKIIEALPSQLHGEEQIASELNTSKRTLQRRLKASGTSYEKLLQETRKELALDYIANKNLSIQEVSYLLGFTEAANFSRAFKRWTGTSPTNFRQQQ